MIIVTGAVTANPEALPEVTRLALEHVHRSRLEPGCLLHSVHQDVENPIGSCSSNTGSIVTRCGFISEFQKSRVRQGTEVPQRTIDVGDLRGRASRVVTP